MIISPLTFFAYDLTSLDTAQPSDRLQFITDYPLVFVVLDCGWNELSEEGRWTAEA